MKDSLWLLCSPFNNRQFVEGSEGREIEAPSCFASLCL
jgi:hypothetical protein